MWEGGAGITSFTAVCRLVPFPSGTLQGGETLGSAVGCLAPLSWKPNLHGVARFRHRPGHLEERQADGHWGMTGLLDSGPAMFSPRREGSCLPLPEVARFPTHLFEAFRHLGKASEMLAWHLRAPSADKSITAFKCFLSLTSCCLLPKDSLDLPASEGSFTG